MSGAEAAAVIGLISSIISIIEGTKKVYDAATNVHGLPKAFGEVANRLPIIENILSSAGEHIDEGDVDEESCKGVKQIIEVCESKVVRLDELFRGAIPDPPEGFWHLTRYRKAIKICGKGNEVENLMKGILADVQLLATERSMKTALQPREDQITQAITGVSAVEPSVPEYVFQDVGFTPTNSGQGNQYNTQGKYIAQGEAKQYITGGGPINFANTSMNIKDNHIEPYGTQIIHVPPNGPRNLDNEFLHDLRSTNPSDDKTRIEQSKGGLLKDAYRWIFNNEDFQRWGKDKESRLLWIRGEPGKGKTMLLIGIIRELEHQPEPCTRDACLLSYFFCQGTDILLNNATAVLRGLIYLLLVQEPSLMSHIREEYRCAGKKLFEDANAFYALSKIFMDILSGSNRKGIRLIIDALDECETNLTQLLGLVVQSASIFPHVKWIVSSRNKPDIEALLKLNVAQKLSLEQNSGHVARAVETYIDYKVSQLASIDHDIVLQDKVRIGIHEKANGTFLWVALVFQELEKVESWDMLDVLKEMPVGLKQLYDRMIDQVQQLPRKDPEFCGLVLSTVTLAYRPLHLRELGVLSGLPKEISSNLNNIVKIIGKCGSFLTLQECNVYFIHQTAKDYLQSNSSTTIFPIGRGAFQYDIFSRSILAMSKTLQKDIYKLRLPGILINSVQVPDPDPLAPLRYSCVYWISHFDEAYKSNSQQKDDLEDNGKIHIFLQKCFLYWLEALSLVGDISEGLLPFTNLEFVVLADKNPNLHAFIYDAKRFALYNRSIIEEAPLQLYCSALFFAPERSIVRKQFEKCIPIWIEGKSKRQEAWSATLQTLEGHLSSVNSVALSPNNKLVASGSQDKTVRLWNSDTGMKLLLAGHSASVNSVAFSIDSKVVASGSQDKTIRLWNSDMGKELLVLKGHSGSVNSVAFSPDGTLLASGSKDGTIRLWDTRTWKQLWKFKGHSSYVKSVAFSGSGKLASGSLDKTVRLWDPNTKEQLLVLTGDPRALVSPPFSPDGELVAVGYIDGDTAKVYGGANFILSVAFSPDGKLVASGSEDDTIRIWNSDTGEELQILEGHSGAVNSVAFSPDGKLLASGSEDSTIRLWDTSTWKQLQELEVQSHSLNSIAFSQDGKLLVSGSEDKTIRLWDSQLVMLGTIDKTFQLRNTGTGEQLQVRKGHSSSIKSLQISPDGEIMASCSLDKTVRLWETGTGKELLVLEGHSDSVDVITFSPDSKLIASGSRGETIRLWETSTGMELLVLEACSGSVDLVHFSPDGTLLASTSSDENILLWNSSTGEQKWVLEGHFGSINSITFSPDGKLLASESGDETIRLWDTGTGKQKWVLEGHSCEVLWIAFSPCGKFLTLELEDETVQLWDTGTGKLKWVSRGDLGSIDLIAFSPDDKLLALGSGDQTIQLWDTGTGEQKWMVRIGITLTSLSFSTSGHHLVMDMGVLELCSMKFVENSLEHVPPLVVLDDWVMEGEKRILWLPADHRTYHKVCWNEMVVLGYPSGEIIFIKCKEGRKTI